MKKGPTSGCNVGFTNDLSFLDKMVQDGVCDQSWLRLE